MITVSRIFIFGGVPLILFYLWRKETVGRNMLFAIGGIAVAAGVGETGWIHQWKGLDFLLRLFAPPEESNYLTFYSAGPWNSESNLLAIISDVFEVSPLTGVGAAGWQIAYDSGWTEALVLAGVIGALCHGAVLLAIFGVASKTVSSDRRQLTFLLAVFLLGVSMGVPSLTANRLATIVWLLVSLLVLAQAHDVRRTRPRFPLQPSSTEEPVSCVMPGRSTDACRNGNLQNVR